MSTSRVERTDPAAWDPSPIGFPAAPKKYTVISEDDSMRVASMSAIPGSIEKPDLHRRAAVFVVGFYEVLSANSIAGVSASCAQDPDVATLLETSAEVAIGWPDVLETWKDKPFASVAERSFVMRKLAIKVHASIARVAGMEQVRGKLKNGESFAFSALGINVDQTRGDKWLIVHHHASKAAERLTS